MSTGIFGPRVSFSPREGYERFSKLSSRLFTLGFGLAGVTELILASIFFDVSSSLGEKYGHPFTLMGLATVLSAFALFAVAYFAYRLPSSSNRLHHILKHGILAYCGLQLLSMLALIAGLAELEFLHVRIPFSRWVAVTLLAAAYAAVVAVLVWASRGGVTSEKWILGSIVGLIASILAITAINSLSKSGFDVTNTLEACLWYAGLTAALVAFATPFIPRKTEWIERVLIAAPIIVALVALTISSATNLGNAVTALQGGISETEEVVLGLLRVSREKLVALIASAAATSASILVASLTGIIAALSGLYLIAVEAGLIRGGTSGGEPSSTH